MRRLLIVDDEPFIVNGLSALIKECNHLELEVYKAYSADEAIAWFGRSAMDVVLTDICMPGMDGLELQQSIVRLWPRCKIIFLTGHDDFAYVKKAIHHGAVDYVLKTEGDRAILAAVDKALDELKREVEKEDQLVKARSQFQTARPFLQKEFLLDLLHGELQPKAALQKQMDELGMSFSENTPVLLILAKVDEWADLSSSDKALLLYAAQNIAEEYLSPAVRAQSFPYDRWKLAWLIQPQPSDYAGNVLEGECRSLHRFVLGTVERIQQTCRELLKVKLSFAVGGGFSAWLALPERFDSLQRIMRRTIGMGQEEIVTDEPGTAGTASRDTLTKEIRKQTARLEIYLESGQPAEFGSSLREVMCHPSILADWELRLIASYQILSMVMTFSMNEGHLHGLLKTTDLGLLLEPGALSDWEGTIRRLTEVGEAICRQKEAVISQNGKRLISRIHEYIEENLSGDLSLTRIGEVVFLNPVYVSRVYKQLTGDSLSDKIMSVRLAEAMRQLKESEDKVQGIATRVGFESAAYFIRFFKKATGRTPQEYREFARGK